MPEVVDPGASSLSALLSLVQDSPWGQLVARQLSPVSVQVHFQLALYSAVQYSTVK